MRVWSSVGRDLNGVRELISFVACCGISCRHQHLLENGTYDSIRVDGETVLHLWA